VSERSRSAKVTRSEVQVEMLDGKKVVAKERKTFDIVVPAERPNVVPLVNLKLANPKLWSPDSPSLYWFADYVVSGR